MTIYEEFSPCMKKYSRYTALLLLIGLMFSSFAFGFWYFVSGWHVAKEYAGTRQISVSGEGKVSLIPDIATFTAGVTTISKSVAETQRENAEKSNAIIAFLKEKKVEEKDIKTVGYSIYPQYQYYNNSPCVSFRPCPPQRPPEITSYEVRHTLEIKVRDLSKTDQLLSGVVTNGANDVGSITFTIENEESAKAVARKKAIDDAEKKARVLARDLGVRLGHIMGFSESGSGVPIYARASFAGLAKDGGGEIAAPSPEVQPGEQEIRSTVTITYGFR